MPLVLLQAGTAGFPPSRPARSTRSGAAARGIPVSVYCRRTAAIPGPRSGPESGTDPRYCRPPGWHPASLQRLHRLDATSTPRSPDQATARRHGRHRVLDANVLGVAGMSTLWVRVGRRPGERVRAAKSALGLSMSDIALLARLAPLLGTAPSGPTVRRALDPGRGTPRAGPDRPRPRESQGGRLDADRLDRDRVPVAGRRRGSRQGLGGAWPWCSGRATPARTHSPITGKCWQTP